MGSWKLLAFRGEGGKPPRANALWGLASLSIPAGVSQLPIPHYLNEYVETAGRTAQGSIMKRGFSHRFFH